MNALRTALLAGVLALGACSTSSLPSAGSETSSTPVPASSTQDTPVELAPSSVEDTTQAPEPITRQTRRVAPAPLPPEEEDPVDPIDWPTACELVNPQEEVPSAAPGRYTVRLSEDTGDTCTWQYQHGTHRVFPLRVSLHPGIGLEEASLGLDGEYGSPYTYVDIEIGGRNAVRIETTPDAHICGVALPSQDGHVFVRMQTWDLEQSCTMATTAAEKIEPRLRD